TGEGASFLFGDLARQNALPVGRSVLPPPKDEKQFDEWIERAKNAPVKPPVELDQWTFVNAGAFVAFGVLPTIIFFSSLMAVMYHIGLMQLLIRGIAWLMQRTMRTSGAETLSAAGNIFVGQTEAPLLIAPFVKDMTVSELMAVMTGGFATVAGGVMIAYVAILYPVFPDIAGHLLCASIMSAPAALVVAKIMVPEPDPAASKTFGTLKSIPSAGDVNVIDAAARGAAEGLKLALNVGAMLLAFISLIALINGIVGGVGGWVAPMLGYDGPVSLQLLLGALLKPVAWLMGVPWVDAGRVGGLLGVKTILNEFYAYVLLSQQASALVSPRSMVICTYALCGFANFSSIAIQLGGISGLAPERRADLARLGLRAMIGGTLAAFMTACVIGMLI
ncbi:MAG: nucleoside transporter C-terminal domain-containing protein, partial [Myxococcota bacterium]